MAPSSNYGIAPAVPKLKVVAMAVVDSKKPAEESQPVLNFNFNPSRKWIKSKKNSVCSVYDNFQLSVLKSEDYDRVTSNVAASEGGQVIQTI